MFIATLKYTKPVEDVDRLLDAHREYIERYMESGHFTVCGRLVPRTGGVIMGRAENREEMLRILHEDPFYTGNVADYDLVEFQPTRWSNDFEGFKNL